MLCGNNIKKGGAGKHGLLGQMKHYYHDILLKCISPYFSENTCDPVVVTNAHYTSRFGSKTGDWFTLSCYPGYQATEDHGQMECDTDRKMINKPKCQGMNMKS